MTAGRAWLNGAKPRSATVRRLTATVLTEAAGTPYTATDLWGEHAASGTRTEKTATDDLIGRRSVADVLATATAWTATDPHEQATLHPADDSQLLSAVWDATRQSPLHTPVASGQEQVLPAFVDVLEGHLGRLRRLDDTAGGGTLSQRYVRTELAGVLDLARHGSYTTDVGTRLLATASGMAQLAGWMAFDADLHAAAQRHQLLAIRLARAAHDTTTIANVLGMLAYQHAAAGKPAAALRYAEAAIDHTARSNPLVRARAWGRMATAHAAAGDINAFRDATERCRTLLERRRDDDPPSLYYFTRNRSPPRPDTPSSNSPPPTPSTPDACSPKRPRSCHRSPTTAHQWLPPLRSAARHPPRPRPLTRPRLRGHRGHPAATRRPRNRRAVPPLPQPSAPNPPLRRHPHARTERRPCAHRRRQGTISSMNSMPTALDAPALIGLRPSVAAVPYDHPDTRRLTRACARSSSDCTASPTTRTPRRGRTSTRPTACS
ncbi:hypothetical protein SAZ11_07405 [Streptomyces sp. FXJ1.4098]|nr:hypothetical protein [Streptomyces sp. FXJ1.4098]